MAVKAQRLFGVGDQVKVAKKSRVVDRDRLHEGLTPEQRIPIDQDVTGVKGRVIGAAYESPGKGEMCLPVQLENGAMIGVPDARLERVREGSPRVGYSPRYSRGWDKAFSGKSKRRTRK